MTAAAIITLIVIVLAIFLFATEWLSIDLVAIMIIVALVFGGVLNPEEAVAGFSNKATLTVAFMFVISGAILKTGALQLITGRFSTLFRKNFTLGMALFLGFIVLISAFVNNTPVVAVFIPVVIQLAKISGKSASKLLIPLSYAAIWGGVCTLIGTSTNIIVSGIAEKSGLPAIGMFQMAPIGIILAVVGILYLLFLGDKFLPDRNTELDLNEKFGMSNYITDLEILPSSDSVEKKIMDAPIIRDFGLDVLMVKRGVEEFNLPAGDFVLKANDILKVRCDIDMIKNLKDAALGPEREVNVLLGTSKLTGRNVTLVEMVVAANSEFQGMTLRELDFRRRFRAIVLAIRQRKEVLHSDLYDCNLRSGDVILAEVKTHFIKELKKMEGEQDSPFIILSEDVPTEFNSGKFKVVMITLLSLILSVTLGFIDMMVGSLTAVAVLVLSRCLSMNDAYESINWQVIFLLAGSLSIGTAMKNSGLDLILANALIKYLQIWGPVAVIAGLYFVTALLGELMSNNATAALITPIAIATAFKMEMDPMPFIATVIFAASASFMTPVGYQTNAMVYSAGQYRFTDFIKVGIIPAVIFWILVVILVPIFYPF